MAQAKTIITRLAVTAAAVLAAAGASAPAYAETSSASAPNGSTHTSQAPHITGSSFHGCPYGAVCVYPQNKGWNGDHPGYSFYSYAGHNIYNEYGTHRIVDNQYGSHAVGACAGGSGTGGLAQVSGTKSEGDTTYAPTWWDLNLTPVNSFDLRPYSQFSSLCHR